MNNKTEEINIVYVIDFIKKNLIFSIFLPLIISIGYFFYQFNYSYLPSQKMYEHSKQFYVIDSKNSFDLSLLSESILKLNKIFDYAEFKLNFLFTDFILINAESSNDKIIYSENQFFEDISGSSDSSSNVNDMINDNFIKLSLIKYLNKYNYSYNFIKNESLKDSIILEISIINEIENKDEIEEKFSNLEKDINNFLFNEINNLVNKSLINYETEKNHVLKKIETLNEALIKSYKVNLQNTINELKDDLVIASEVGLNYPLEIEFEQTIGDDNFSKGTIYIIKKIELLEKKLNMPVNIPQLINNNTYYDLVKSDFYKQLSINDLNKSFLAKKKGFAIAETYSSINSKKLSFSLLSIFVISVIIFVIILVFNVAILLIWNLYINNEQFDQKN